MLDKKEAKIVKSVRLSKDLIKKVEEMAKKENRNFTNMVEDILIKA